LRAVEMQVKDQSWKRILGDVRKSVEEGASLNEAMAEFPTCFDSVTRSLIAAGESAGNLERMLQRLSVLLRKQLKTRNTLVGAMVYPILLIVVAISVLCVMILGVLPRFSGLFDTFDMDLPPSTAILMDMSAFLKQWWWAVLVGLVPVVVSFVMMFRTARGRHVRDTIMLKAPKVGALTRSFSVARICRMLGVLLDSKVPLLDALELTRESSANIHYRDLLVHAEEVVAKGDALSKAFQKKGLVNPSIIEAIRNGEESGQLAPVLLDLADFLDEDNEVIVKSATSILEPIILIVLGIVVAIIALSMFLPLFDLTSMAGGQ
ncbi:MAG: type II secretion system F family protein, partial [Phycisphaerales bacterium]|nr:type II secretion system F family protein [Phycisphaerales bacterium]